MKIKFAIEASERERKWLKRAAWIGIPLVVVAYLVAVFLAGGRHYHFWAYATPEVKEVRGTPQCQEILRAHSMNAMGAQPAHSDYRSDANLWLFQSHGTRMYTEQILRYPECLGFNIQGIADYHDEKIAIVIYDTQRKKVIYRMVKYPIE